ncbi:MAG: hypothetical protein C0601_10745 [Candidatus Muiribacterium halophilum]|uniref:KpsF/GutQ family sugar-phosphate isomerase n=1 Tax=Muiribacterium halophilum TaxID=2053465 RepID=A0A2N5ZBN6_MUIH1|nr:MAG: hypothetical protein C0601_10745 [Candidatus Muirbacterium halophilum]
MLIDNARKIIELEARSIQRLCEFLDSDFENAIESILLCEGRVVVSGMGKSGLIGKKISATLASTGTPSFFMHPAEAIHGDLGMLKKEDILLAISNSGETEEIVKMIPYAKKIGTKIICITGKRNSFLAVNSDYFLNSNVEKEAGKIGLAPTCSTTAQLVLGDALAITVSEKKSFESNDFAQLHPGGTLGRKLLGDVSEVMNTGEAIPMVRSDKIFSDALEEISRKRLGFTTVCNDDSTLLGIITDGDVRRILMSNPNSDIWNMSCEQVMTKDPMTISPQETIAKAIEIMENKSITTLIITDEKKNIVGVVHLHDLLGRGKVKIDI